MWELTMTDSAYRAKNWLMRADELDSQWRKTRNRVSFIQNKLHGGVSNYYGSGKSDLITAQASHEDLLLEYSLVQEQFEKELTRCLHEDNITLKVIDRLSDPLHRSILIAKYICRISLNEFSKRSHLELKRSQLYEHHNKAIEELALILDFGKPDVIPQPDKDKFNGEPIQAPA